MADLREYALAVRTGLPPEMRYLIQGFPRDTWVRANMDQTAAFWLQMHDGFRSHQTHMDGLVDQWRTDGDLTALHRRLIPALQAFLQHLDGHHRVESGHYFPALRKLEPRIDRGIELLDRDHDAVHETLEALIRDGRAFHQAIIAGAPDARDNAERLGDLIAASGRPLLRHLEDEEDIVIPLIRLRGAPTV